ncbi:MAG: hypothetical protein IPK26_26110 [Planctomycetes bacterium]|nr:hypothetical protein [Planctomycetota bacterium]
MGSIPITRSSLLVRNERANERNTFLLLRLRRQMLVGFEDAHDPLLQRLADAQVSAMQRGYDRYPLASRHSPDAGGLPA